MVHIHLKITTFINVVLFVSHLFKITESKLQLLKQTREQTRVQEIQQVENKDDFFLELKQESVSWITLTKSQY